MKIVERSVAMRRILTSPLLRRPCRNPLTAVLHPGTIAAVIIDPVQVADTTWREEAACLRHPSMLFFGLEDAEGTSDRRMREDRAKQICSGCNVRIKCLEYALATREAYGIWGGLTELERRARLRRAN